MHSPEKLPPLIVILGPTAVGKTSLSIDLAENLNGEIVSADSRLFYRGMDIGTDKPSMEDRARVPHYLIDVANPDEVWSLAKFQRAAFERIADIHARQKLPFLVGGTGQYIRAVTEGWVVPPQRPDHQLRNALEGWAGTIGAAGLHARLAALDPDAADKIDPRNLRRTVRAMEVILRTGERFSDLRQRRSVPYRVCTIGLMRPRDELYKRVDVRIHAMMDAGWVEEVEGLLAQEYSPTSPSLSAIGYREICAHLNGDLTLEEAVVLMKRRTRQFIRRQANWFKTQDPNIQWFMVEADTLDRLMTAIRTFLSSG